MSVYYSYNTCHKLYKLLVLAYLACNLLWNRGDSNHPCINKEEKSSPKSKSISTMGQICIRNISWATMTEQLHPPQVQMKTLELLFFTSDLNTLKISSLVPHLRKKINYCSTPYDKERMVSFPKPVYFRRIWLKEEWKQQAKKVSHYHCQRKRR